MDYSLVGHWNWEPNIQQKAPNFIILCGMFLDYYFTEYL